MPDPTTTVYISLTAEDDEYDQEALQIPQFLKAAKVDRAVIKTPSRYEEQGEMALRVEEECEAWQLPYYNLYAAHVSWQGWLRDGYKDRWETLTSPERLYESSYWESAVKPCFNGCGEPVVGLYMEPHGEEAIHAALRDGTYDRLRMLAAIREAMEGRARLPFCDVAYGSSNPGHHGFCYNRIAASTMTRGTYYPMGDGKWNDDVWYPEGYARPDCDMGVYLGLDDELGPVGQELWHVGDDFDAAFAKHRERYPEAEGIYIYTARENRLAVARAMAEANHDE